MEININEAAEVEDKNSINNPKTRKSTGAGVKFVVTLAVLPCLK